MLVAIIIAAVVIIGVVALLISSRSSSIRSSVGAQAATKPFRLAPPLAEFHVKGEEALVTFAVPVPEGETDKVLAKLLSHEAVEVVREKAHDLPIDQVRRVIVFGQRAGSTVEVGRVDLDTPGQLPPPMAPEAAPHASSVGFDPLAAVDAAPAVAPGVAPPVAEGELAPLASEITLTGSTEAGLRAQGFDPGSLTAGELGMGLLRLSGYTVNPRGPDSYAAVRAGKETFLRVVDHEPGGYPELEEKEINQFVADFVQSGAAAGLLFTEKYCPFGVYEREKREPRIRFVSRERIQDFVNAFSVT
ncbi:MAG: hypothetical protein OEM22_07260 [Acidimicrobiia bacterium]|nr:hypothetical protein [Acidimicrobiia bacterium]MDH3470411.1 hypothetical protein [Acidimicrobiia bacterium]